MPLILMCDSAHCSLSQMPHAVTTMALDLVHWCLQMPCAAWAKCMMPPRRPCTLQQTVNPRLQTPAARWVDELLASSSSHSTAGHELPVLCMDAWPTIPHARLQFASSTTCGDYDPASGVAVPFTTAMCGVGKEYDAATSATAIAGDGEATAITKCCKVCTRIQSRTLEIDVHAYRQLVVVHTC